MKKESKKIVQVLISIGLLVLLLFGAMLIDRVAHSTEAYRAARDYCSDPSIAAVYLRSDGTIKIIKEPRGTIVSFLSPDGANPLCEADGTYDVSGECAAFLLTDEGWEEICVNDTNTRDNQP